MNTELLDAPATQLDIDRSRGDFVYPESHEFDAGTGLSHDTIDYIATVKNEPEWIREFRHKALDTFLAKPMPTHWASHDLENIVFQNIRYYLANAKRPTRSWEDVPDDVKKTFERLGIPEQERKFLAGVEAQFDSEAVYSNMKKASSSPVRRKGSSNIPNFSRSGSGKLYRQATTNSVRSTARCLAAARLFTSRRA